MMEMQGNVTEIDERNLLQLDALLSHGYGLSPQLVMRSKGLSIEAKLYGYNPCSVKYDTTTRSSVLDTSYNWSTAADLGTALDLAALYPQDEIVKYGTKLTFAGPWSAWCEDAGKTRCVSSTPGVYATSGASGSPILSATIKGNTTVYVDWPWSGYDGVMSARS